jgi:hypothetical protein
VSDDIRITIDPQLEPVSRELDALAAADAASADPALEDRLAAGTAWALRGGLIARPLTLAGATSPRTARAAMGARLALAAALGLAATIGAALLAPSPAPSSTPSSTLAAEKYLTELLLVSSLMDEHASIGVATLRSDVDQVGQEIRGGWDTTDLIFEEGAL